MCPSLSGGGAEKATFDLAKVLSEHYDVHFIGIYQPKDRFEFSKTDVKVHALIKNNDSQSKIIKIWLFLVAYFRFIKYVNLNKPYIIHANCEAPELILALTFGKFRRFVTIHVDEQWKFAKFLGQLVRKLLFLEKTKFVVVSTHIKTVYGLNNPNCDFIPNILSGDLSNFYNFRENKPLAGNPIKGIAFVGRLHKQKNPFMVLEFAIQTQLPLILVGSGSLLKKILDEATSRNFHKITVFPFDNKPWEKIPSDYLTLVPSIYEGDGLVAFEALTLHRPVLLSRIAAFERFQLPTRFYFNDIKDLVENNDFNVHKNDWYCLSDKEYEEFARKQIVPRLPHHVMSQILKIYEINPQF